MCEVEPPSNLHWVVTRMRNKPMLCSSTEILRVLFIGPLQMKLDVEQLKNLPKVMQLPRGRAEIQLKRKPQTWVCSRT